jgi:hypothetical protein
VAEGAARQVWSFEQWSDSHENDVLHDRYAGRACGHGSIRTVGKSHRHLQIVQICQQGLVGYLAHITQNGPDLNLLNEAGEPARAWPDWFAPATRIWIERWNEGAVYSPDAMTIQFDNGSVWERDLGPPLAPLPAPPPLRRR